MDMAAHIIVLEVTLKRMYITMEVMRGQLIDFLFECSVCLKKKFGITVHVVGVIVCCNFRNVRVTISGGMGTIPGSTIRQLEIRTKVGTMDTYDRLCVTILGIDMHCSHEVI